MVSNGKTRITCQQFFVFILFSLKYRSANQGVLVFVLNYFCFVFCRLVFVGLFVPFFFVRILTLLERYMVCAKVLNLMITIFFI